MAGRSLAKADFGDSSRVSQLHLELDNRFVIEVTFKRRTEDNPLSVVISGPGPDLSRSRQACVEKVNVGKVLRIDKIDEVHRYRAFKVEDNPPSKREVIGNWTALLSTSQSSRLNNESVVAIDKEVGIRSGTISIVDHNLFTLFVGNRHAAVVFDFPIHENSVLLRVQWHSAVVLVEANRVTAGTRVCVIGGESGEDQEKGEAGETNIHSCMGVHFLE